MLKVKKPPNKLALNKFEEAALRKRGGFFVPLSLERHENTSTALKKSGKADAERCIDRVLRILEHPLLSP